MATTELQSEKRVGKSAVSTSTLATLPPTQASMAPLVDIRGAQDQAAPRDMKVSIKGSTTEPTTQGLTVAYYWGWDEGLNCAVLIGMVNDGLEVTLSSSRGFSEVLTDVPAGFSHFGITGTLSAGTATWEVTPMEAQP